MNTTANAQPMGAQPPGRRRRLWRNPLVVMMLAFTLSGALVLLHHRQSEDIRRTDRVCASIRQARVDLGQGFMHAMLGGTQQDSFDRDRGISFLNQAMQALSQAEESSEFAESGVTGAKAQSQLLRGFLPNLEHDEPLSAEQSVRLRLAFHQLQQRAEAMDFGMLSFIRELEQRHERNFMAALGGLGALMLAMAGLVLYSEAARNKAEALKRQAELNQRRWADAFNHCGHGIAMSLPTDNRVLICNAAFAKLHHRTMEQAIGVFIPDLYYPGEKARVLPLLHEADDTGHVRYEARMRRIDGTEFTAQMDLVTVRDESGALLYRVATAQDITEQRHAEKELLRSESQLRLFAEHAPAALAMFDLEMCYLSASRRWLEDYGLQGADLVGRSHYEVFPEIGEEWRAIHRRGLAGEVVRKEQDLFVRADGSRHWLRWEVRPWTDAKQVIGGLVVFSEDITARVNAQEALWASELRFSSVIRNLNEGLVIAKDDGTMLHWNPAAVAFHGFRSDEEWRVNFVHFTRIFEIRRIDGTLLDPHDWPMPRVMRGERVHDEELILSKPGTPWSRIYSYSGSSFKWGEDGGVCAFLTMTDVSLRVESQLALSRSEERFQYAMMGANDGLWDWDLEARTIYLSPRCKSLLGYAEGDLPNDSSLWPRVVHPEDLPRVLGALEDVAHLTTGRLELEVRMLRKDGHPVHVLMRGFCARNDGKSALRIVGTHADITERKRVEEEVLHLNASLEQRVQERTAALQAANREIESFSYSVSHDLRAPLRAIDGFLRIISESYGERLDDEGRGYLQRVLAAADRMSQLIDDLLNLARINRVEFEHQPCDLVPLSRSILAELARQSPGRQVDLVLPEHLVVQGDPRFLRVMMENLLGNAWKFTARKPAARIELGLVSEAAGRVTAYVRDNGAGFDMAYAGKLFSPFQRLHRSQEFPGTGIGLATVQRIAARHGGRVWAEAAVDQGATLFFELPGQETPPPGAPREQAAH